MSITLPPEVDSYLRDQVAAGRFPSVTDAVCEAVLRLRQEDETRELRRLIEVGIRDLEEGRFTEVRTAEEAAQVRDRLLQKALEKAAASKGA